VRGIKLLEFGNPGSLSSLAKLKMKAVAYA